MLPSPVFRILSRLTLGIVVLAMVLHGPVAAAREPGDPIRLAWMEGDVAGLIDILSPDGRKTIGYVEYHQLRHGDIVNMVRVAHFADGSSDEDQAEARVGDTLEAQRGRSIIRDTHGKSIVDIKIDVAGGSITGFYLDGTDRKTVDDHQELHGGTYWGPLINLVVKNFAQNATDDHVVFTTVVATPKPRVINMELARKGTQTVTRVGGRLNVTVLSLLPTVNFLVDPIVQRIAPETTFLIDSGKPPVLVRFLGPRNYQGQKIRLD